MMRPQRRWWQAGFITLMGLCFILSGSVIFKASAQFRVFAGDVNADGIIDLADAILCLQVLCIENQDGVLGDSLALEADINRDNRIGIEEAIYVLQVLAGRNAAPLAIAGPHQKVNEGEEVTLDGSGSADPDPGDKITYQWTQVDGPSVSLSDATEVNPTFTAPDVGFGGSSLTFQLVVTDIGGLTGNATCVINVKSPIVYSLHGINFSPYIDPDENPTRGGIQISDEELKERLELIAPFTHWIRTYACNDDLKEAGKLAHSMGLKAAIGAWLGPEDTVEGQEQNQKQIECLVDIAKEGNVELAIVGSEVLLREDLSENQLISYIKQVKMRLAEEPAISIQVTTGDVYGIFLSHPQIIKEVDLVLVNYYPYWENRKVDYAMAYVHRWHEQLKAASGEKEVIVSEAGWPSCGEQRGEAVPSPENASFYFLNFISWARANDVKYFYFEAFDEAWKANPNEGPQGACWGIWDRDGRLKPGMEDVFDGEVMDDNWSELITEEPIIDFSALPTLIQTNISTFVVSGTCEPSNQVILNGTTLSTDTIDDKGNFVVAVELIEGENLLKLEIKSEKGESIRTIQRVVHYDDDFRTGNKRLLYVDSVSVGSGCPAVPGTIVIDLDQTTFLGLIKDRHVVGISPDGSEIYTGEKKVISTDTHKELRTLPFTGTILSNAFVVSPDGTTLYSLNERVDVASNTKLANLPMSIETGRSWQGAPIPGGPAISADGSKIYCGRYSLSIIDTSENTVEETGINLGSYFLSDIALTPDQSKILLSLYSYASGKIHIYDAYSFDRLGSIYSLGDFVGEIVFSKDGMKVLIGSAGNPESSGNGGVFLIDLEKMSIISRETVPLADNVASSGNNEFFVSSGESDLFNRLGIDVYELGSSGDLVRKRSFFLGINGFKTSAGIPANDQIRRIVFKP